LRLIPSAWLMVNRAQRLAKRAASFGSICPRCRDSEVTPRLEMRALGSELMRSRSRGSAKMMSRPSCGLNIPTSHRLVPLAGNPYLGIVSPGKRVTEYETYNRDEGRPHANGTPGLLRWRLATLDVWVFPCPKNDGPVQLSQKSQSAGDPRKEKQGRQVRRALRHRISAVWHAPHVRNTVRPRWRIHQQSIVV
jgi:hypothetical protein